MTDPLSPGAVNEQWRDAFNAGDLPRLMTMYEPHAVLVPGPDVEPLQGHAAIEAALGGFLALGGQITFAPRYWIVQGDLALGSIAFTLEGGRDRDGAPVELRGTTAEVVRRQTDGSWKYVVDHPFGGASQAVRGYGESALGEE
jgi:ketosteroid isomerase-like protein